MTDGPKADSCTKIHMEFQNDVLGPYSWEWNGELAEKVFRLLRPFVRDAMMQRAFPGPVIRDLRKEPGDG